MTYVVGARSDRGKRSRNEDSIFAACSIGDMHTLPLPSGLFVVTDGTGAYADGQEASSGAIQAIVDVILPNMVSSTMHQPEVCIALLTEAVQCANKAVYQQNADLHSIEGTDIDVGVMTTVTAAMVIDSTAYIANVGDSRTYLYRASEGLKQVTTDHLVVARLIEDGTLEPDAIYTHFHRNQIYRTLFDQPLVEVDIFTVPLRMGDTLLLCSDGLWTMAHDPQIAYVLSQSLANPSQAAEALIQAALEAGGKDNVSVIVVSLLETEDQTRVPSVQLFARPDRIQMP